MFGGIGSPSPDQIGCDGAIVIIALSVSIIYGLLYAVWSVAFGG